jgi:hypothetical protein
VRNSKNNQKIEYNSKKKKELSFIIGFQDFDKKNKLSR